MAKYNILYKCGHTGHVTLFGKTKERYSKIEYYETLKCKKCILEDDKIQSKELMLPDLCGSEKQINWAISIRLGKLSIIKKYIERCEQAIDENKNADDVKRAYNIINKFDELINTDDSRFWIDNRHNIDINLLNIFTRTE